MTQVSGLRASNVRGNFPQAFSHVALVNSAMLLSQTLEPEAGGARGSVRN